MNAHCRRLLLLTLVCVSFLTAQSGDDSQLKLMIIFGRHAVRSPNLPNKTLDTFSTQPFPAFTDASGNPLGVSVITPNGAKDEAILGDYFRLWLINEGLLTTNDAADAGLVYFRAPDTPLITDTAKAFWTGLLPAAGPPQINVVTPNSDPLFTPVAAGIAVLDYPMAMAAVNGRLGDDAPSLATAYAPELALTRSILFNYPAGETPPPAPAGKFDVTDFALTPVAITAGNTNVPVSLGGLSNVVSAIDPFVMEYADGLAPEDVGWGQMTLGGINQTFRLYDLLLDLEYRTPYLAGVQSSNVASHIVRSLVQAAIGNPMPGALATPATKVIALIASNTNITGLAGLFHLDWILPSYEPDVCAPSGALVFELRQSQTTAEFIVRVSYVAQTMDQLRDQTPLTFDSPPAIAPVFVPGCSVANATFDCPLAKFVGIASQLIDPHSADFVN